MNGRHKKIDLGLAVKRGAFWTLAGRALIFCMTLGGGIVLARLLEPEDFGLFGIALLFTGLATRFGNIGFGLALIQREEIHEAHISSLFTTNLVIFPSLALLLMWGSPLVGEFFNSELAGRVLAVLSCVFFATPFSSVARVLLQRRMDFKGPVIAETLQHFSTIFLAVLFAFSGYGVWSLVYGELCGAVLSASVLVAKARWKPRLSYDHRAMKELYAFGVGIFFKRLLVYGSDKIDFFIIGKQLGPAILGFYEKAFSLMNLAVKEMGEKLEPVLFSAFSRIHLDRERTVKAYHKVLLTFSLIGYPIFFGLMSVAPFFIPLLYGEKWMPSVAPLQILCIAGLLRLHLNVASTVINAMGKVTIEVWIRSVAFVFLGVGCYVGSHWGITGVATAVAITNGFLALGIGWYFCRLTGLTILETVRPQIGPLAASLMMYGVVMFCQGWFASVIDPNSFFMLFALIAVGVVSYAVVLCVIQFKVVLSLAKEFSEHLMPVVRKSVR